MQPIWLGVAIAMRALSYGGWSPFTSLLYVVADVNKLKLGLVGYTGKI